MILVYFLFTNISFLFTNVSFLFKNVSFLYLPPKPKEETEETSPKKVGKQ